MINRKSGESQTEKNVNEILESVSPEVKSIIEGFNPEEGEIVEIDNIDELTIDDFNNPRMNKSFNAHNDEHFILSSDSKRIGFECKVYDFDENIIGTYTFMRDNLGRAFEDYNITLLAMIAEIQDQFFEFRISKIVNAFFQQWRQTLSNEQLEEIDAAGDRIFYEKIKGTKGLDAILKAIDSLDI